MRRSHIGANESALGTTDEKAEERSQNLAIFERETGAGRLFEKKVTWEELGVLNPNWQT